MKYWLAVYTKPRHEKMAYKFLCEKNIETYLPLIRVKRKWSDRYKWIEKPIFNSYLFVHIELKQTLQILQTLGVHHFVKIGGEIIPIRDSEINGIKNLIEGGYDPEPTDYFVVGDEVEIIGGPLRGLKGLVNRKKGNDFFVLKIDTIQHAIQCRIERKWLKSLKKQNSPSISRLS
jgi:transcription antitermination factor NusG